MRTTNRLNLPPIPAIEKRIEQAGALPVFAFRCGVRGCPAPLGRLTLANLPTPERTREIERRQRDGAPLSLFRLYPPTGRGDEIAFDLVDGAFVLMRARDAARTHDDRFRGRRRDPRSGQYAIRGRWVVPPATVECPRCHRLNRLTLPQEFADYEARFPAPC